MGKREPISHVLPVLTFVLTLGIFRLAVDLEAGILNHSQNSRKLMKINDCHEPFGGDCAVSSVVEHFLDTEGVRGSNPLSRTIFL